jgi:hypothetical protein
MKWRERARPVIARVIKEVGLDDMKALRKALRDAYPFGEKAYFPYKVWLDEIAIQTMQKRSRGRSFVKGQGELFGEPK